MKGGCGQRSPAAQRIYIMDEKDRTIVTFGDDPEPEKVSQNSGIVSGQNEFTVDVDVPKDVEAEEVPHRSEPGGHRQ